MKIENSPSAYGFLAGAFVLILGLLANAGCGRQQPTRSADIALESTVLIEGDCLFEDGKTGTGYGSGVIVDPHTLITAWHVVDGVQTGKCIYTAVMTNGTRYPLARGRILAAHDLAVMTSETPFAPTYPIGYAQAQDYGGKACIQTAYPRWGYSCGELQASPKDGTFGLSIVIEPGNSGSGVYDANGRLIGIVTSLLYCGTNTGQICAGRAVSLWEHLDELL